MGNLSILLPVGLVVCEVDGRVGNLSPNWVFLTPRLLGLEGQQTTGGPWWLHRDKRSKGWENIIYFHRGGMAEWGGWGCHCIRSILQKPRVVPPPPKHHHHQKGTSSIRCFARKAPLLLSTPRKLLNIISCISNIILWTQLWNHPPTQSNLPEKSR